MAHAEYAAGHQHHRPAADERGRDGQLSMKSAARSSHSISSTTGLFEKLGSALLVASVLFIPLFFVTTLHDTFDLPKLSWVYAADAVLGIFWLSSLLNRKEF